MQCDVTTKRLRPRESARASELLVEARRAAPELCELAELIIPRLPSMPRASQNLRAITLNHASAPTPLEQAITLPWVAFDSATHRNCLLIDIDDEQALDRWLELPAHIRPDLVIDPWSGRAHAIVFLAAPVLLQTRKEAEAARCGQMVIDVADKARLRPQKMADLAGRLLAAALGGNLLPPGSLTKNPWGLAENLIGRRRQIGPRSAFPERWDAMQAHGQMWSVLPGAGLMQLRAIVGALRDGYWLETAAPTPRFSAKRYAKKRGEPCALGRNTRIFDLTRWWAYDHVEKDGGVILSKAFEFNDNERRPLPPNKVITTARSITRFMNTRYRPRALADNGRGRDKVLGEHLSVTGRQRLSGKVTATARSQANDHRITLAIDGLRLKGKRVTQAAVAAETGFCINTIAKRWKQLLNPQHGALSGNIAVEGIQTEMEATTAAEPTLSPISVLHAQSDGQTELPAPEVVSAFDRIGEPLPVIRFDTPPLPGDQLATMKNATHWPIGTGRVSEKPIGLRLMDCPIRRVA